MVMITKTFSELTTDELYEILRVRNEVFVVEQECMYLDLDNKDQNAVHLFTTENNVITAYLRILEKGQTFDEISIGRVLVTKEGRGKGHAKTLMIKAIDHVFNTLGETSIRISAQEYLLEFYASLGFKKVSDSYLEDDIPHIEMLLTM